MSKKIRINEVGFFKKLINSFFSAKSDNKETDWLNIVKKHDDELAAIFGDFNDRVDKNYRNSVAKLNKQGHNLKTYDREDTDIYKALSKFIDEAVDKQVSKK